MKKVLFVATVVKAHINVFHLPVIKWFKEQGWQVDVAAKNDYEDNVECNILNVDHFYEVPFFRNPFASANILAYKQLKELINNNNYDIIHCHTPVGGAVGRLAAREARKRGTKVVYTAHGFHFSKESPKKNWLIFYPIERELAKHTDVLITINNEDYEVAKKFRANQIELVHGVGMDLNKVNSLQIDKEAFRRKIGLDQDAYIILSIGELNNNKNHIVILEALSQINDPNIHYIICGRGKNEKILLKKSKEYGLEKQVHLMGFRDDVLNFYQIADLFAFPSKREGLSLALMEAMASGLPAIVSKIRGNTDLIIQNKGGLLIDIKSPSDIATKISTIKNDNNFLIKSSYYNKEKIKQYSLEKVINEMAKIYDI